MASIEDITAGLKNLLAQPKYKGKKTQLHISNFNTLVAELNVWLENNDKDTVNSQEDKKTLARVLWHDNQIKNSFEAVNNKSGEFDTSALASLVAPVATGPQYTALDQQFNSNSSEAVRKDVVRVLDISDKHHKTHGSNFSGTQTLRQIIKDVCTPVQGQSEWKRVEDALRRNYPGYI